MVLSKHERRIPREMVELRSMVFQEAAACSEPACGGRGEWDSRCELDPSVTTQLLPYFSFPFTGKAWIGMGSLRCHFYPIPTLTLPLKGRGLLWLF